MALSNWNPRWKSCFVWMAVASVALMTAAGARAAQPAGGQASAAKSRVRFQSGAIETTQKTAAEVNAAVGRVSNSGHTHFVMQFTSPVTVETRAKLAAAGVKLHAYLGDNAYFASRQGALNGGAVAQIPTIQDLFTIDVNWKLHPSFISGNLPAWAVQTIEVAAAPAEAEADKEGAPVEEAAPVRETFVAAYVMFHDDVMLDPVGVNLALRHGAVVTSKVKGANTLIVEMPLANLHLLAAEDEVQWVEPPQPRMSEVNAENRVRTGANIVQAAPYNLDGTGVTVLVYDGGFVRTTHVDFQGRAVNGVGEPACETVAQHSTHVAGTIGGAGIAVPANKGMAPGVSIVSYALNQGNPPNCTLASGFLYTDPGDLESNYTSAMNIYDAHIANNSIGTNTAPNNFPCDWEGNYGVTDVLIDRIIRGTPGVANGQPFRVVWANGNERGSGRCGTTYRTTAPPACAKNHITVGALNSNDDSLTSFTSWGPADDGRMKPDISGPGCQVGGDNGVTSCNNSSDTSYAVLCGTSMASPTVCGLSALLLQDFRVQFPSQPDFRNSTLKILFAHTAVDLGNAGPDNQYGYGSVRIQPAVDFMRSGNFLESETSQGQTVNFLVVVNPGDPEFKATLAWDDVAGTPNVSPALVNDLDLVVFDPSNTQRFPWTLDVNNPGNPAVQTQKNAVDNIEQVRVASPAAGVWRIEVRGFNVPQGPQPFSLCASPLLVNCSRQGVIALDRTQYNCTATASIKVVDCDLNTDDNVVETVNVTINSNSEPGGETVVLTETGAQTADFRGTINLSSSNGSGVLQVANGDTVTATYVDADDGQGGINVVRTSVAAVDCAAPLITNVQVSAIGPRTATVTFTTNEPTKGTIRYGTSCGSLGQSAAESAFVTSHTFVLTGLADQTQHFFALDAVDASANTTTDDNGGSCYTFTTAPIPDTLTEEFASGDFDLDNKSLMFTPNGSIDVYALCSTNISVLPTDPAGGTALTLADNANVSVALSGGSQVSLYGVNYSSFFVGSNGYITFTAGDTDSTPTVLDHFDTPRISALFANLNPALGGTVSWKQLADRAVVTWENVPQATTTNTNTLQVEMYFDGRIRISYLTVDLTSGIAGLSAGAGIPADYAEMDLSAAVTCGPQPPAAASRSVETPVSVPVNLTLVAGDDGIPGPLTYIVTALPTSPLEDLGNNHVITGGELPYTLVGGGNQVRFHSGATPTTENFQFKVNDGGTPPTGGDSNTATVTIVVQPVLGLPFFDDFPTTTFDPLKWAVVDTATIDDVGLAEPSAPNSARFNGQPNGGDELRTHLINLSGQTAVRLSYWFEVRGGGESPDAGEDLIVEFMNNVGSWELISQHLGTLPDMTTYQQVSVLLPPSAFHPAFRLRFRNSATTGASDDWFVDDVSINVANAPTADNTAVTAPFNGFLDITLSASDPNLDPLTYTVLSLPANGSLKDVGGGMADITTVPYVLAGNGNVVRYTPQIGFGGVNTINFKASDGTYESNVATVTVTVEPVLNLPFFDDFPTTTFDPGKWGFVSNATIDTVGIAEPSEPNSLRMNGNPSGVDEVYTFAINLAGETAVQLSYYYELRGGGDSPETGDDLVVYYRDSVGNWQEIQRHLGSGADMTTYQQVTMLLPAQAFHPSFRLRFRSTGTTGATTADDWFVDNVSIISLVNPVAQNSTVGVAVNATASAEMVAADPNNDTLTYIIQSLPTNGLLKDPNGGVITTVPYSVSANGNAVLYKAAFNYQGPDSFTFKVSDGVHDSGVGTVSITVGGAAPIHSFPMNSDPGWSCDAGAGGGGPNSGGWAFGPPMAGQVNPPCQTGAVDPPSGFTGANVYGYNLAGCYTGGLSPTRWLTTTAIDCSSATGVQLRFRRWLGVESSGFDQARIQMSTNGSTWSDVWVHSGATISETSWSQQTYAVPAADNQATVFFRWGIGNTDLSVNYQGWNIDDVEILGFLPLSCPPVTPGDVNGDLSVDGLDIQLLTTALLDPFQVTAAQQCAADVNQDNAVNAADAPAMVQVLLTTP